MASCSLAGASNLKLFTSHSEFEKNRRAGLIRRYTTKCAKPEAFHGLRGIEIRNQPACAAGFNRRRSRVTSAFLVSCTSSGTENDPEDVKLEENNNMKDGIILSSVEVRSLLNTICDTTSIAEFELKLAGFRVYVKRDLVEKNMSPPALALHLTQTISSQTPELNGSAAATSLAISNPKPPSEGVQSVLNTATDEGLVILQSPKVGFFRKSRTIKGKRAPPSCKEKQEVKEGQVLCYIEQLGGEIPIESDVSGEIIKILRADGEPVGYGDALIAILPSFPGIKKLQ